MTNVKDADQGSSSQLIELLTRKYLLIWVWSIVFGLNTSMTVSISYFGAGGKYAPQVAIVLLAPSMMSSALLIISWFYLLQSLSHSIVPLLVASIGDGSKYETVRGARLLERAMKYAIFAVIMRLFGIMSEGIFGSLGRF